MMNKWDDNGDEWETIENIFSKVIQEKNLSKSQVDNIQESLKESIKEMKLIRQGKLPKRNLDDFLNQLEQEKDENKQKDKSFDK